MLKHLTSLLLLFAVLNSSYAQIKVSSSSGTYDSIHSGVPYYYQFSWDDPLDEIRDSFNLVKPFKAFEILWDSALVSDGSILMISSGNPEALLSVDATGWDLIDKGWEDTVNYPNLSPVMLSLTGDELEWRNFGFARELDTLLSLPSTGNVKIKINADNTVDLIYGDFAMVRPDLCFEGFGGLRPSVTFINGSEIHSWIIFGDPTAPVIDSTYADTALNMLPALGQKITVDFNKTNFIKKVTRLNIRISPNPVKDILTVRGPDLSGRYFQVISFDGKIVLEGKLDANQINLETLKTGNYILKIQDKIIYTARFMKASE